MEFCTVNEEIKKFSSVSSVDNWQAVDREVLSEQEHVYAHIHCLRMCNTSRVYC